MAFSISTIIHSLGLNHIFFGGSGGNVIRFTFNGISFAPRTVLRGLMTFTGTLSTMGPTSSGNGFLGGVAVASAVNINVAIDPSRILQS